MGRTLWDLHKRQNFTFLLVLPHLIIVDQVNSFRLLFKRVRLDLTLLRLFLQELGLDPGPRFTVFYPALVLGDHVKPDQLQMVNFVVQSHQVLNLRVQVEDVGIFLVLDTMSSLDLENFNLKNGPEVGGGLGKSSDFLGFEVPGKDCECVKGEIHNSSHE